MDKALYTKDLYLIQNPSLHIEDSFWKFDRIKPLLDNLLVRHYSNKNEIKILEVGGGGGIIISKVSEYMKKEFNLEVTKFILDLSPAMLSTQKGNNPDLKGAILADIIQIPILSKKIDIVFCIDVLEHVSDFETALKEISRISCHSVFKVPLESNVYINVLNLLTKNSERKKSIKSVGHLHFFNYFSLIKHIRAYCGTILDLSFSNNIGYQFSRKETRECMGRFERKIKRIALLVFKISPKLCSILFNDFCVFSVYCRN